PPACTSVAPLKLALLSPERISVLGPTLMKLPEPLNVPLKVVEFASPSVKLPLPRLSVPAPDSSATAWLKLFRSKGPEEPSDRTLVLTRALLVPSRRVPPLTVVGPV